MNDNPLARDGFEVTDTEYAEAVRIARERYFTAGEDPTVVQLRENIQALAVRLMLLVPRGRNQSEALARLEDVQMRGNRARFATTPDADGRTMP
jgi:hypothetical protein